MLAKEMFLDRFDEVWCPLTPADGVALTCDIEDAYKLMALELGAPEWAASMQVGYVLATLVLDAYEKRRADKLPIHVLELGSGFTSCILGSLATRLPCLTVTTIETDPSWHGVTCGSCKSLSERHQVHLSDLKAGTALVSGHAFDVVFNDIGGGLAARMAWTVVAWNRIRPGGVLLADDAHRENYRDFLHGFCSAAGATKYRSLWPETLDQYGRYALGLLKVR